MALSWWQRLVMKRMSLAAWRARFGARRQLPLTIERLEPRCIPSIVPSLVGSDVTFNYSASPVNTNVDVYLRTNTATGNLEWSETLGGPYLQDLDLNLSGDQVLHLTGAGGDATINVPHASGSPVVN